MDYTTQYVRNHSLYLNVIVPYGKDTTFPPLLNVSVPTVILNHIHDECMIYTGMEESTNVCVGAFLCVV